MDALASSFILDSPPLVPGRTSARARALARLTGFAALTLTVIVAWMCVTVGYFIYLTD